MQYDNSAPPLEDIFSGEDLFYYDSEKTENNDNKSESSELI